MSADKPPYYLAVDVGFGCSVSWNATLRILDAKLMFDISN